MKLAISNIAWPAECDSHVFHLLNHYGYSGLEIAPTRIVPHNPYSDSGIEYAHQFLSTVRQNNKLHICSMQSILYGINQNLFSSENDRNILLQYIFQAIDFAKRTEIPHLVFGCPKNRIWAHDNYLQVAMNFFRSVADYAKSNHVIIGIEANPPEYGTNFLNTTEEVFQFITALNHDHCKINLDLGAMLMNKENISTITKYLPYISHVHISEPMLGDIQVRKEHDMLFSFLEDNGYMNWISIEMKDVGIEKLEAALANIKKKHFASTKTQT